MHLEDILNEAVAAFLNGGQRFWANFLKHQSIRNIVEFLTFANQKGEDVKKLLQNGKLGLKTTLPSSTILNLNLSFQGKWNSRDLIYFVNWLCQGYIEFVNAICKDLCQDDHFIYTEQGKASVGFFGPTLNTLKRQGRIQTLPVTVFDCYQVVLVFLRSVVDFFHIKRTEVTSSDELRINGLQTYSYNASLSVKHNFLITLYEFRCGLALLVKSMINVFLHNQAVWTKCLAKQDIRNRQLFNIEVTVSTVSAKGGKSLMRVELGSVILGWKYHTEDIPIPCPLKGKDHKSVEDFLHFLLQSNIQAVFLLYTELDFKEYKGVNFNCVSGEFIAP
jgi:hypothetical protein